MQQLATRGSVSLFGSLELCSHVSMVTVCLQGGFVPQHSVGVKQLLEAALCARLVWPCPSHSGFCLTLLHLQSVHRFLPKRNPKPPFSRLTAWSPPAMEVRASFFLPPASACLLSWRCQLDRGLARAPLCRSQRSAWTGERPDGSSSKGSRVLGERGDAMMPRGTGQRRVKTRRCEDSLI